MRFRSLAASAAVLALLPAPASLHAQGDTVHIYRYTLDTDVPESAGMIAVDATPLRVLRGGAPKPVMASAFGVLADTKSGAGAAVDVSPYWLASRGRQSLERYRRTTLSGWLGRMLTRTVVSLAAIEQAGEREGDDASLRAAVGVRSTFVDAHDPLGAAFGLPERVQRALGGAEGVDSVYASVRREVRAECCVQLSGGWGLELRAPGGEPGKLGNARHVLWLAGQITLDPRWDLLTTLRGRGVFDSGSNLRTGVALQYRTSVADLFIEAAHETNDHRVHPGVGADVRLARNVSLVTAVAREMDAGDVRPRLRSTLRWYQASH